MTNTTTTLTVYQDNLTDVEIVKQLKKVRDAFPSLQPEFFVLLQQQIIENKFTDKKLIDSVNNLIKTCVYPVPTIANILNFDKTVKLYEYKEILDINNLTKTAFTDYQKVDIGNNEFKYAKIEDIKTYNLPKFYIKKQ